MYCDNLNKYLEYALFLIKKYYKPDILSRDEAWTCHLMYDLVDNKKLKNYEDYIFFQDSLSHFASIIHRTLLQHNDLFKIGPESKSQLYKLYGQI